MGILLRTPSADELAAITREVGEWHSDSTPFQLHPGDIGWFGWRGDEVTAAALRTWWRDGQLVAAGLLDGPGLLRLAVAPAAMTDPDVADAIAGDIAHEDGRALPAGEADVEAPAGATLRDALVSRGWASGDEWTHLRQDVSRPISVPTDLRVEVVDQRNVHVRSDVHRAAFGSEAFTDERWRSVAATPAYRSARCLVGLVGEVPAAAITVWSGGRGARGSSSRWECTRPTAGTATESPSPWPVSLLCARWGARAHGSGRRRPTRRRWPRTSLQASRRGPPSTTCGARRDTAPGLEYLESGRGVIQMTFTIRNLDSGVETRLTELATSHGRTMEAEAAEILTAATRGEAPDSSAVMGLYVSARRVVSKEALAPPTQVDFCPDGF